MMNFDEAARLVRLRERVIWATREALKEDGHHKSSEACTTVSFNLPSMFSDDQTPFWSVEIYAYVVGPSRQHTWFGKTLPEALAKAEDAVTTWCAPFEVNAFGLAMEHASDCNLLLNTCSCGADDERKAMLQDAAKGGEKDPRPNDDEIAF